MTKGSFTKLAWDRLVDLLQIRPYKSTQKEKDVQAMISQPERFQIHDSSDDDAASIPTIKPNCSDNGAASVSSIESNHKNRKNKTTKRGQRNKKPSAKSSKY